MLSIRGAIASVLYLDSLAVGEVEVSMVHVNKGSYVEVFAEQAIGRITKKEAEFKRDLRLEMNRLRVSAP